MPTATAPRPSPRPWIFNPAVDLLVGCGGWSLPLLLLTFYLTQRETVHLSFVFYFLGVFCNQPHYMATVYRAYRTPGDFQKYRFFTLYVTIFIVLAILIVHLAPALFPWLFTFYLTWSPWHYTGQNYGIAMMLARRAGAQPTDKDRILIRLAYFASYATWFLALHNTGTPLQPTLVIIPIPAGIARAEQLVFFLIFLVAGGYAHSRLIRQTGFRAMSGPLTLFATQFLWFLLPEVLHRVSNVVLPATYASAGILAFMHCAQYLWITTYYARREAEADKADGNRERSEVFRFGRYYFILVLGGLALFVPGPWLASRVFGHDFVESFFIFTALVNLHHFILDGAIWKLRDGRIARLLLGRNPPGEAPESSGHEHESVFSRRWLFGPAPAARGLRYAFGLSLLGLGLLDQTQFWLTLKHSGQPALALAQLFNPQDTRVYFQKAQEDMRQGKNSEAMAELRHAIAINPHNAPALHLLGELLTRSGDAAAALAHYDRMTELLPPDLVVLANSGALAAQTGDLAKARARYEAAIRLAPSHPELHLSLGQTLESAGEPAAAIKEYERFEEIHATDAISPENTPLCLKVGMRLGNLYLEQKQTEQAAYWYRAVFRLGRETGHTAESDAAESALRQLGQSP
jgi:tetratricopeptide (TPR) repeat protein